MPFKIRWLLRSEAVMGTHKGSKMKNAWTSPVRKYTSLSTSTLPRSHKKPDQSTSPLLLLSLERSNLSKHGKNGRINSLLHFTKRGRITRRLANTCLADPKGPVEPEVAGSRLRARMLVHNGKMHLLPVLPKSHTCSRSGRSGRINNRDTSQRGRDFREHQ